MHQASDKRQHRANYNNVDNFDKTRESLVPALAYINLNATWAHDSVTARLEGGSGSGSRADRTGYDLLFSLDWLATHTHTHTHSWYTTKQLPISAPLNCWQQAAITFYFNCFEQQQQNYFTTWPKDHRSRTWHKYTWVFVVSAKNEN